MDRPTEDKLMILYTEKEVALGKEIRRLESALEAAREERDKWERLYCMSQRCETKLWEEADALQKAVGRAVKVCDNNVACIDADDCGLYMYRPAPDSEEE